MIALALMWAYDLNLYTIAYFDPASAQGLFDWRGLAVAADRAAVRARRQRGRRLADPPVARGDLPVLSLLAICAYFAVMAVLVTALRGCGRRLDPRAARRAAGGDDRRGDGPAAVEPRARGWAKVKIAKHLFEHRYDYRTEWLRFTETHRRVPGPTRAPLGQRVIKAFADILDAPGGLLLVADENGSIEPAADWNWPGSANPGAAIPSAEALRLLAVGRRRRPDHRFRRAGAAAGPTRATASSTSPPPCSARSRPGPACR